jgi:hypothetical protein
MKLRSSTMAATFAVVALAASANAANITFNTNAPGTGFNSGATLSLGSSSGASATLQFTPDGDTTTGTPSNVNLGEFTLACITCTTQQGGVGSVFNAFTIDLVITDVTDGGAQGKFVGTSTGGTVFSDVSQLTVNWAPLVLGPNGTNAISGNFGATIFTTTAFTAIVAPNSGTSLPDGVSTVQGQVSTIPEPTTVGLVGLSLLGLGLLRRKSANRG